MCGTTHRSLFFNDRWSRGGWRATTTRTARGKPVYGPRWTVAVITSILLVGSLKQVLCNCSQCNHNHAPRTGWDSYGHRLMGSWPHYRPRVTWQKRSLVLTWWHGALSKKLTARLHLWPPPHRLARVSRSRVSAACSPLFSPRTCFIYNATVRSCARLKVNTSVPGECRDPQSSQIMSGEQRGASGAWRWRWLSRGTRYLAAFFNPDTVFNIRLQSVSEPAELAPALWIPIWCTSSGWGSNSNHLSRPRPALSTFHQSMPRS